MVAADCERVERIDLVDRMDAVDFGVTLRGLAAAFFLLELAVDGAGDCVLPLRDDGFGGLYCIRCFIF